MVFDFARSIRYFLVITCVMFALTSALTLRAQVRQKHAPPTGVEEICSIVFDKDVLRPARVENGALPCLEQAVNQLKASSDRKLVLVGVKDPAKDHEPIGGSEREEEDASGFDVRLEDLAAYRAVNTKWYLVHYHGADPTRILPTTDESYFAQTVTVYLVPASADFDHNFLGATKTNEKPCTIKPCYSPDEETLTAQQRPRILKHAVDGSPAVEATEKREFTALKHRKAPVDMSGTSGDASLAPLLPRPTPEHPATTSIIPK